MGGKTCEVRCKYKKCGEMFTARIADRKRGWARFCSKSCKAKQQEQQTHQHRDYLRAIEEIEDGLFTNAHMFSNEEHDCNKEW